MSGIEDIDRRLEELESQAAFQEELNAQLNQVVARQDREIRDLQRQVQGLTRRLKEVGDSLSGAEAPPGAEIPPHY